MSYKHDCHIHYCIHHDVVRDNAKLKPSIKRKYVGTKAIFICDSSGPLSWYFESSYDTPRQPPIYGTNPLTIYPVQPNDSGQYFCYGLLSNGEIPFLASTNLKVYGKYYCVLNHLQIHGLRNCCHKSVWEQFSNLGGTIIINRFNADFLTTVGNNR